MSRGHGKVQRAVLAAFAAEPDNAFLLSQLCEQAYPGCNRIEKKHRIAVARAAKAIPSITYMKRGILGSELVFYDPLNVMSYAMALLKSLSPGPAGAYRNNDYRPVRRQRFCGLDITSWRQYDISSDQIFREMLAPGGSHHKYVVEGGSWQRHVQFMKRRHEIPAWDTAALAALDEEIEANRLVCRLYVKSGHVYVRLSPAFSFAPAAFPGLPVGLSWPSRDSAPGTSPPVPASG
jgi:hypothetical protein